MRRFFILSLLGIVLATTATAVDVGIFNEPSSQSASGSGGSTSPGGTVTGANQYRSAGGTFAGDDNILDDGAGNLTALGVSATTISVTNVTLNSNTLLAGQGLYARLNGAALVMDGSAGFQYNQATNRSIFAESDLPANTTPSATVHVSGTLLVASDTVLTGNLTTNITVNRILFTGSGGVLSGNSGFLFSSNGTTGSKITFNSASAGAANLNISGTTILSSWTTIASTSTPVRALTVDGQLLVTSNTFLTGLSTGTATNNLCITATGLVISSTTLSGCLGVSDPALKKDIHPLAYGLAEVLAVDAVTYKDIRPGGSPATQVGFLAYSVDRDGTRYRGLEAVMPDLVDPKATYYNGRYYKGVIYERAIAVAYKAIQQQQAQIATLQAAVDELRTMQGMAPLEPHQWWKFWK